MTKLKISPTVTEAIQFGFSHILAVARVGWIPFLLMLATYGGGMYFFLMGQGLDPAAVDWQDETAIELFMAQMEVALNQTWGGLGVQMAITIAIAFFFAPLYVALFRYAIDDVPLPRAIAHFTYGSRAFTFAKGSVALTLLGLVFSVLVFFMERYIPEDSPLIILMVLVMLVLWVLFFWVMMRLTTFFPTMAVENHLDWRRAFRMTKGNFWRVVAVMLLMALLMAAIAIGILLALLIGVVILAIAISFLPTQIGLGLLILVGMAFYILFMSFYFGATVGLSAGIYGQLRGNAD